MSSTEFSNIYRGQPSLNEFIDNGHKALGKISHRNETIIKIKVRAHPKFISEEKMNFFSFWKIKESHTERKTLSVKLKSLALTS